MDDRAVDFWSELRAAGMGDGRLEVPSRETNVDTGYGKVRMALGEQGEPRLLVPCAGPDPRYRLEGTSTLKIGLARFRVSGSDKHFIDLLCGESGLEPVFGELANELLNRLDSGETPYAAVSGTIDDFRSLLLPGNREQVSREKLVGMVGEMHLLLRLAEIHGGNALDFWVGPSEQRHDFRCGEHAIEVKTSARSDSSSATIHGLDQLAPPEGGELLLVHLCLEETTRGNLATGLLFDKIVHQGVDALALAAKLEKTGCEDPYAERWNHLTFSLEGEQAWSVDRGFPRLTNEELAGGEPAPGVNAVRYTIELGTAGDFKLSGERYMEWLRGMTP